MSERKKVGYVRVSTDKQETNNQKKDLLKYGIDLEDIYDDSDVSGVVAPKKRRDFKKVYDRIMNGEVEELYVFEISRLGRTSSESIVLFIEIEQFGTRVRLTSPNEKWMTDFNDTALRNFLIGMLAWFAEMERRSISERTKLALRRKKEEGIHLGRNFKEPDRSKYEKHKQDNPKLKPAQIARLMSIPQATLYRWIGRWEERDRIEENKKIAKGMKGGEL